MKSSYRIAHFSDFHLEAVDKNFTAALVLVDQAIAESADHVLITGDVVDSGEMDVFAEFCAALFERGLAHPAKLTMVPGNHDLFSLRNPLRWRRPTANHEDFCATILPVMRGRQVRPLSRDEWFPVAKSLRPDVTLVALDSTRNGQYNPRRWAEGELRPQDRRAVTRLLAQASAVQHRILAMHHSPWDENMRWGALLNQNFAEPEGEAVQAWIKDCGATFLFCGHVHTRDGICRQRIGSCRTLRAGTAGGCHEDDDVRVYHLVDFHSEGKVNVRRRTVRV